MFLVFNHISFRGNGIQTNIAWIYECMYHWLTHEKCTTHFLENLYINILIQLIHLRLKETDKCGWARAPRVIIERLGHPNKKYMFNRISKDIFNAVKRCAILFSSAFLSNNIKTVSELSSETSWKINTRNVDFILLNIYLKIGACFLWILCFSFNIYIN